MAETNRANLWYPGKPMPSVELKPNRAKSDTIVLPRTKWSAKNDNETTYRAKPFVFWATPEGEFIKVKCCSAEDVERERDWVAKAYLTEKTRTDAQYIALQKRAEVAESKLQSKEYLLAVAEKKLAELKNAKMPASAKHNLKRWHEELVERLAELEHEQWCKWSKDIASKEKLSEERLKRWQLFWIPYDHLGVAAKDEDRVWARSALNIVQDYYEHLTDSDAYDQGWLAGKKESEARVAELEKKLAETQDALNDFKKGNKELKEMLGNDPRMLHAEEAARTAEARVGVVEGQLTTCKQSVKELEAFAEKQADRIIFHFNKNAELREKIKAWVKAIEDLTGDVEKPAQIQYISQRMGITNKTEYDYIIDLMRKYLKVSNEMREAVKEC
jgi:hypothetical protein